MIKECSNGENFISRLFFLLLGPGVFFSAWIFKLSDLPESQELVLALFFWMASWWVQERIPQFVTSLLPLFLLPVTNVSAFSEVSRHYVADVIFLFLGGFLLARGLEKTNTHLWLASLVISSFGKNSRSLLIGLTLMTAFLSMWISNTAAALIMIPLGLACLEKEAAPLIKRNLVLLVAYAASIGGVATLIGSPPNAIAVSQLKALDNQEIRFFDWMMMALPFAILGMGILLGLLTFRTPIAKLTPPPSLSTNLTRDQKKVLGVLFLAVVAWFTAPFFPQLNLSDAMIGLVAGMSLFLIPICGSKEGVLSVSDLRSLPWDILYLFGGGLALSGALKTSGLTEKFANLVNAMSGISPIFLLGGVVVFGILLTELSSNTAVAALLLPILIPVAATSSSEIPPPVMMVAVSMAASLSFMLPIATPPNAIAYASGHVRMKEMMKVGLVLNLVFALLITLYSYFVIPLLL